MPKRSPPENRASLFSVWDTGSASRCESRFSSAERAVRCSKRRGKRTDSSWSKSFVNNKLSWTWITRCRPSSEPSNGLPPRSIATTSQNAGGGRAVPVQPGRDQRAVRQPARAKRGGLREPVDQGEGGLPESVGALSVGHRGLGEKPGAGGPCLVPPDPVSDAGLWRFRVPSDRLCD